MKLIALAAVLALGAPAIAQDVPQESTMPQQGTTTTPPPGTATPPPPTSQQPPADAPMPSQTTPPPPTPGPQPAPQPAQQPMAAPSSGDPVGGYQPSAPALSGTPQAGQQVIFRQSVSPEQAFPPPAALEEYPVCSRNQTDRCRQRGGR